jgi:ADP-ribosylglycohydrolase
MRLTFEDRVVGAAVGHALGDALGFQVEQKPPEVTVPYADAWLRDGTGPEPGREGYAVGQVSDDAQCARATMLAVADGGRYALCAVAEGLIAIRDDMVGPGRTVSGALGFLKENCSPRLADLREVLALRLRGGGSMPPTNGAAMRIWPVAATGGENLAERARWCARLTHDSPESVAGALVVALATRAALDGLAPRDLLARLSDEVSGDAEASAIVAAARLWTGATVEWAYEAAWEASRREPKWRNVSPRALPTVAWALRAYVLGDGDYVESVREALGAGGDVDTVAAIAGGLAGAYGGPGRIPAGPASRINDRGRWGFEDQVGLARRFAAACPQAA